MKNNIEEILLNEIKAYELMDNIIKYRKAITNNISNIVDDDVIIDVNNKKIITKNYVLTEI